MQVLRELVVNCQNLDDQRLLMMFCGVNSLGEIDNKVDEDPPDREVEYAKQFIMKKANEIVEKRKKQKEMKRLTADEKEMMAQLAQ